MSVAVPFHSNTRRLISDWQELKADRVAPARSDIAPEAFRDILPQLFILGCRGPDADRFRLAGGLLFDLHGRELRGSSFLALWAGPDREDAAETLTKARANAAPAVIEASAWTDHGHVASLEIVLAPLVGPTGEIDRVMGLYQPTSSLRRLLGQPVSHLTLRAARLGQRRPQLRLAAIDGERIG